MNSNVKSDSDLIATNRSVAKAVLAIHVTIAELDKTKNSRPTKGTEVKYPRYHPASCIFYRLSVCLTRSNVISYSVNTVIQKRGSGGKFRKYLNLRQLPADGFLSLTENKSL